MLIQVRMKDSKISKLQNSFIYGLFQNSVMSERSERGSRSIHCVTFSRPCWHFLKFDTVAYSCWRGDMSRRLFCCQCNTPDCRRTRLRITSPGMRQAEAWFSAPAQAFGDSEWGESAVSLNVKHGSLAGGKNWFENRSVTINYATVWFT